MGYYTFTIPKGSGGTRLITAPDDNLKKKQRLILRQLQRRHWLSRHAHGFRKRHDCLTNASVHAGKKYIVNIDIKDFFPSITTRAYSDYVTREINAIYLSHGIPSIKEANTVFHQGRLPQGAPTSPFISNLYMRRFDTQIQALLRKYISDDILYTRYADDLTFSSNSRAVEKVIVIVRDKLKALKLDINNDKTKFMSPSQRQEVTGLNINSGMPTVRKTYRRKVRAMIHRASTGWLITAKDKECLLGMISHIALCHHEEADRYRAMLLPVAAVSNYSRKFMHSNRVRLQGKRRIKKKKSSDKATHTPRAETKSTVNRKIRIRKENYRDNNQ